MTPRQSALALIATYGAELDDNSRGAGELIGCVIAPTGIQFLATGCHTIAINFHTDRPAGWRALLADLRAGVQPCDDAACQMCEPAATTMDRRKG
jgi:hypothetical protein